MKKTIFNNLGLKIISVFIAFLIWLMVVNGDDPEKRIPYKNIKVEVINEENFIEQGQVYDVKDDSNIVTVRVRARRSVLAKLSSKDFRVVADLENITFVDTVPLIIYCSDPTIPQENMECDPPSLKLTLEDKGEETFMISVAKSEQAAAGYEVGSERVIQGDSVIIEGPVSLLKIIDKVVTAPINVSSITSDQKFTKYLDVIDKNGAKFTESQKDRLIFKTMRGSVLTDASVDILVKIWEVQSFRLEIKTTGEPAAGYQVTNKISTPTTINLAGSEDTLKELERKLVLEDIDILNITEKSSTIEGTIDISDYLQEHYKKTLKLETDAPETISVKIQIEEIGTSTLNILTSQVRILGQPEDMDMILTPADKIPIEVRPLSSNAPAISVRNIQAELDLTSYQTEGDYKVQLKIKLPADYELVNNVTIAVNLAKKQNTIVEE